MYKVKLTARAKKELKTLPKRYQVAAIVALKEDIKEDPAYGKPLTRELIGRITYRVGVYRIIYKINKTDKLVTVFSIGHRGVVYKK